MRCACVRFTARFALVYANSTFFFRESKKDGGKWEAAKSYKVEGDDFKKIIDKYEKADTIITNFRQRGDIVSFTIVKWPKDDRQTASDWSMIMTGLC